MLIYLKVGFLKMCYLLILLSIVSIMFALFIFSVCRSKTESFTLNNMINHLKNLKNLEKVEGFTEILSNESKIINNLQKIKQLKDENDHLFKSIKKPSEHSDFAYDIIYEEHDDVYEEEEFKNQNERKNLKDEFDLDDENETDFLDQEESLDIHGFIEPFTNNFDVY
jgi:hypothetical protein